MRAGREGLVLGMDGGGSKTHVALADSQGRLRALVTGPGTGLEGAPPARIASVFRSLVEKACRNAGSRPSRLRAACCGLNGIDVPRDVGWARRILARAGVRCPTKVHNDAFLALFSDGWRERGAVVTSGSGVKWLAANGKREAMHDGLVLPGLRESAMTLVMDSCEGFRRPSHLSSGIVRWLGFRTARDFHHRWRYGRSRSEYIRPVSARSYMRYHLMPVLLGRLAARGDREALALVDGYAESLVRGTLVAARRAGLGGRPFPVVTSGSVLANIPVLRAKFTRRLARLLPGARVVPARWRPVRGALVYASHAAWGGLPAGSLRDSSLCYLGPSRP